ncbi:MAG TPA: autoinducer 2 ABC transporter substrate-binding protein [Marisediminicola sp.]|jgi:rhamnose transport system substrate-binding protein|nr:sugar transporter substrate-binding protein [Cryobacterium sp.]HEV7957171.1 autoinducer 2 ABC transporter substrate-binding protein [Marisediminicola sp.]
MKKSRSVLMIATASITAVMLAGCSGGGGAEGGDSGGGSGGGSDEKVTVAFVPKLQGVPYFEAMNAGAQRAAEELGNIEWLYQGPTTADAAAQADVVRSFIQQQVDVLIVAPNDPDSLAPLLKEAQDAGIHVGTSDTDAPNSVREVFVNQATAEGIAKQVIDSLAKAMGEAGEYAIVSCGETAENLNSWIDAEKAYQSEAYPDMTLVEVGFSGEDPAANAQMATDFMNANPNLTGLVGQCTTSAVGVAQAVRDAGAIGKVFSVGVGTPQSMLPYLEDKSSSASILWDVEEFGYLTAWAGLQLGLGNSFEATNNVSKKLPSVEYVEADKMLILGPALEITVDNAGDFDY